MQFNGYYGCAYCLDKGIHISNRHLYMPDENHVPRCESDILDWAVDAARAGKPKFGVKGKSVLSPYTNITKSVPIDYMHAVLEGVAKTMLCKLWFDTKYHTMRFYLGREVNTIDKMLCRIKPPHEFRRSPRPISTSIKYWKASELRAWLLFYAVPILLEFLPADYVHHLCLLVCSMHILLNKSISSANLQKAEQMLLAFYNTLPQLYPQEACTYNMHSMIHVCESVKRCGPLWTYSCFGFENMNGYLKKHCHGTRNVLPQLVRNLRMKQLTSSSSEDKGDGARGRIAHKTLSSDYIQVLRTNNYSVTSHTPVFLRYKLGSVVYHSWNSDRLRNSSICKFIESNGQASFGSIRCFCFCDGLSIAIIAVFGSSSDIFESVRDSTISELNRSKDINSYLFKVQKISVTQRTVAVPTNSIICKCVHIPIKGKSYDYIVTLPNTYEHH